jgi:hypothetical protein
VGLFELPKSETSINYQPLTSKPTIAKSISGKTFSDGNILYTIDVENKKLDKNIWTIQDKIDKPYDLTIAYLYDECFAYQLDRKKFTGIDWRKDIDKHDNDWEFIKINSILKKNICVFMKKSNLNYGRFDFLADKDGENAVFLEVNRNGQWAWLDMKENTGLYSAMKKIYDPE